MNEVRPRASMLVTEAKHRGNETGKEIIRFVMNSTASTDVQKEVLNILINEGLLSPHQDNRRYSNAA